MSAVYLLAQPRGPEKLGSRVTSSLKVVHLDRVGLKRRYSDLATSIREVLCLLQPSLKLVRTGLHSAIKAQKI